MSSDLHWLSGRLLGSRAGKLVDMATILLLCLYEVATMSSGRGAMGECPSWLFGVGNHIDRHSLSLSRAFSRSNNTTSIDEFLQTRTYGLTCQCLVDHGL
jgi:hypothetical protein